MFLGDLERSFWLILAQNAECRVQNDVQAVSCRKADCDDACMKNPGALRQKSYDFAKKIVRMCMALQEKREFVLSKQLLKSGTSIGANIEEASRAQSRADFIAKLSIAHKEAAETDYWLRLLIDCNLGNPKTGELRTHVDEIIKMLTSSIKTARANLAHP